MPALAFTVTRAARFSHCGSEKAAVLPPNGSMAPDLAPSREALNTPLGRQGLSGRLGPVTGRYGAYPGGTDTRRLGPTCGTQHDQNLRPGWYSGTPATFVSAISSNGYKPP